MKVKHHLIVLMTILFISGFYGLAAARPDGSYGCDCSSCHTGRADQCAPTNQSPVANAGPDQSVVEGAAVSLTGASSSDPDGSIASYSWTQTAGTAVTLSDPAAVSPTFTAPSAGTSGTSLTFQLTVTDNGGLTAADTCIVNVTPDTTPPANEAPVANAGPDQSVVEGTAVTLSGASSSDSDGSIASYSWTQTAGTAVTLSDPAAANPTFTAPSAGTSGTSLTFQLTVTDNGGLTASDTCIINVTAASPVNDAPVANAGPDQTVDSGAAVTLDGTGSTDADDGIASYLWKQTAGPAVTLSSTTEVNPTFTSPDGGSTGVSLTFQLTVTDAGGLQSNDTCIVNVNPSSDPSTNLPPVSDAGPDQKVHPGETVTLDGSNSSDPDDGIASYEWKQIKGPAVTLSSSTDAQPTFTAPSVKHAKSLTFKLTVTDKGGMKSSDTSKVRVTGTKGHDGDQHHSDGDHHQEDD